MSRSGPLLSKLAGSCSAMLSKSSSACQLVLLLAIPGMFAGCAVLVDNDARKAAYAEFISARKEVTHWSVRGRAAVQAEGSGATLSLRWRQLDDVFDINLSGPFGAGAVRISGQPGAVVLDDGSGQPYSAADPESLIAAYTGYEMPVSALRYWILGMPAAGLEVEHRELDASGRPQVLKQSGWRVEYRRWNRVAGMAMPARVDLRKGAKQLRVALSGWQVSNE